MHIQARRIFRLSLTTALALACAYALGMPLPYLAPMFALILTATPAPPMGLKSLFRLLLVVLITLGVGLLLIPLLLEYSVSAVLVVAIGLYFSFFLTVHKSKALLEEPAFAPLADRPEMLALRDIVRSRLGSGGP